MRTFVTAALILAAVVGCSRSAPSVDDPQLKKAETVARYLTSPRHLNRSMYAATYESGTPSELVSYLFSSLGVSEWPPGEDAPKMELEEARSVRMPVFPRDTGFVFARPDPRLKRQLVLTYDDAKREIVAESYLDPSKPPVSVSRWAMPEVKKVGR